MSDFYYPTLDAATIKALPVVQELANDNKAYLMSAPWSGEILMVLGKLFAPKKVIHERAETDPDIDPDENPEEFLANESRRLYQQLKNAGLGLEGSDQLAHLKTSTALLEKLLGMQERANNLKQIADFYAIVMDIMDTELTTDQRTKVMEKLEAAIKA